MKFRHIRLLAYIGILSLTLSSWVSFSPSANCSFLLHNNDGNIFMIETSTCKEMISSELIIQKIEQRNFDHVVG